MRLVGRRGGRPLGSLVGLLVLAAATQASGGAPAPGPALVGVVSGSRVRAMFYDGGGGALLFRGWFDSELGIPCTFARTRNGQMRCLPSGQPAVFFDSTCTAPVWGTECRTSPPPAYVTAWVPGPASVAYALGDPYTDAVRHNRNAGYCSDYVTGSGPFGWSWSYYGVGAEIPSERFVAATILSVPIEDGNLVLRTAQGEDGSSEVSVEVNGKVNKAWRTGQLLPQTLAYLGSGRLRVPSYVDAHGQVLGAVLGGFFDAQADAPCWPRMFADGVRCVPRTVTPLSGGGPYLDAGCTIRVSETRPVSSWPPPASGALAVAWDCSGWTAYSLGDAVNPLVVYSRNGSTCQSTSPVADAVYRLATPAGDSQWAPLTERVE
jgi:hypothetical protein